MSKRFTILALLLVLLGAPVWTPGAAHARAADDKKYTAEQIVESLIVIHGSRNGLAQIRRNGVERGRTTRTAADGRIEESTYERTFIRGESTDKDKVRLSQKLPNAEYALVYDNGRTWGVVGGSTFTPRQEATAEFVSQMWRGIDALLRYKENKSTISLLGKEKRMGVDVYVLDLTDKENRRTRYYISAKFLKVLFLEYEEAPAAGATPVKYMRRFYDYKYAQSTLVPYRTVFFEDGKQTQESRVLTVLYGVKLDESLFRNPDAPATASASQP